MFTRRSNMSSPRSSKRRNLERKPRTLENECYYKILQIQRDSDENDIKKAYRKLAMRWHPDKNKNDPERATEMFKLVAEAFEVLSDPEKRQVYDKYGRDGIKNGVRTNDVDFGGFHFDFSDAASIFEQFFSNDPFFNHVRRQNRAGHSRRGFGMGPMSGGLFADFGDFDAFATSSAFGRDPFQDFIDDSFFGSGFGGNFASSSTSFQTSSSSSACGGISKSTRTTTKIVNGQRVTKTETTIRYPDGRVETTANETVGTLEDGYSSGRRSRGGRNRLGWF